MDSHLYLRDENTNSYVAYRTGLLVELAGYVAGKVLARLVNERRTPRRGRGVKKDG